ncbi:helix-turn-helix transcriptional regulator [Aquamicrobium sp. LC103]|nr:helix-turn-helix transcriptional regulator [Aquamicrobium sp. LC103]
MALAAEMVGDRWTLLILREAFYGVQRYDDMRADLGAPRSMLSDRLARLVEQGIMTRRAYREPGDRERHAYVLTESGRALALTLSALTQWGEAYILGRPAPVEIVDGSTGGALRVALVDEAGIPVEPAKARLSRRGS